MYFLIYSSIHELMKEEKWFLQNVMHLVGVGNLLEYQNVSIYALLL